MRAGRTEDDSVAQFGPVAECAMRNGGGRREGWLMQVFGWAR